MVPVAAVAWASASEGGVYWSRISGVNTGSTGSARLAFFFPVFASGAASASASVPARAGTGEGSRMSELHHRHLAGEELVRGGVVAHGDVDQRRVRETGAGPLHDAGHHHLRVVVAVGDGVLEQGVHGRDELAPVAHDGHRGRGLVQHDLDAALVGRGAHALDGVGHDQVDQHRLARRGLLGLDARQVEQVVDDAADPEGLVVDAPGQALGHLGVGLGHQGLGQQAERAHRRLELVADVGHEVAADLLEPAALGDVLYQRDDAQGPPAVVDLAGSHLQGAPRWAVQIERALGRALVPGLLEQLGHGLSGQRVAVAADHERVGPAVAVDDGAVLVAQHDTLGQRVEASGATGWRPSSTR